MMNEVLTPDDDGAGLWITDIEDARTCNKDRFDRVVTVCQDAIGDNVGCRYSHYNMADGPHNAYGGDSSYEMFRDAANEIVGALADAEVVLVHCHMGQSRSVSVCMAAVAAFKDIEFEEARDIVEDARPQAHPDTLLLEHARKYAERQTGKGGFWHNEALSTRR